jgi:hypothetical protein
MAIPPLILRIYADSSGVTKGVAQASAQVKGLRASILANAGLIKTGLAAAAVAGFAVAAKSASDLTEAQNAANVTFGKSVDIVTKFADTAATSAGLARAEALQAAAGFGAMFQTAGIAGQASAQMSVHVAQLAADLGSLRNVDPTEMLERMRAGLAGEAEPLRRFGVFISEARVEAEAYRSGIADVGATLTDAQKIQARYNIILDDTQKAAGDFARTAGSSMANQLRILRAQGINLAASLGTILLPAINLVLKTVNAILGPLAKFIELFSSAKSPIEEATERLKQFGAGAEQIRTSIDRLAVAEREEVKQSAGRAASYARSVVALDELVREQQHAHEVSEGYKEMQRELAAANFDVRKSVQHLTKAEKEWTAESSDAFGEFVTGTTKMKDAFGLTTRAFLHSMDVMVRVARTGFRDLRELGDQAIPTRFREWLVDQGPAAVHAFVEGSHRQQERIITDWQRATGYVNDYSNAITRIPKDVYTISHLTVDVNPIVGGKVLPGAQHGGFVQRGRPRIVGERGPEVFVPRASGTVIPNHRLAGSGGNVAIMDRRHYVDQADYEARFRGF